MYQNDSATEKHVKWLELKDYYARGQNVILYQHRPQMMQKQKCIDGVIDFQRLYLHADCVQILEFPKFTNRFYFMFIHDAFIDNFNRICRSMLEKWGINDFCRQIHLD